MQNTRLSVAIAAGAIGCAFLPLIATSQVSPTPTIAPDWSSAMRKSQTQITLQVVVNPPLRRGSSIHNSAWKSMAELHPVDARFAMWYPYPRLAVAELAPPTKDKTSWDFSYMDPLVADFFSATAKQPSVLTISTIPQWMFETQYPVVLPSDPNQAVWDYEQGSRLRDDSMQEISTYFARVAQWYIRGGFIDELGYRHNSGHHLHVRYWEVLNEPEYEHALSPEYYTRIYDATAIKLHRISPQMRFVGMSAAEPSKNQHFFEYFLDPSNHSTGVPLDAISYHFYALGHDGETPPSLAKSFFAQADSFLDTVRRIDAVRSRLSPTTKTQINEAGCISANDAAKGANSMNGKDIPASYWNLCGAMFAYLYGHLATQGINILGASQLLGYPSQYPSVSLLNWNNGLPNPRYRVLQLLMKHCHPGDTLISTPQVTPTIYAQAFITHDGRKKVILVNKSSTDTTISLSRARGAEAEHVDIQEISAVPGLSHLDSDQITLHGFSVMIVSLSGKYK